MLRAEFFSHTPLRVTTTSNASKLTLPKGTDAYELGYHFDMCDSTLIEVFEDGVVLLAISNLL
jgi:hypothetical protein